MPSSTPEHAVAYIWSYDVRPECLAAFRHAYGPDGAWVAFFSRSSSYLGTDLLEDASESTRFITIDYFVDAAARARLVEDYADEYMTIDRRWETATVSETFLGGYTVLARR